MEEEIISEIAKLGAADLIAVAESLKSDTQGKVGNSSSLRKVVLRFLSSEAVEDSDDGGLQYFLKVKTILEEMRQPDDEQEEVDSKPFAFGEEFSHKSNPKPPEDDEMKAMRELFMKEFKIYGKIGTTSTKDALSYGSLIFQIEAGFQKGYQEVDIMRHFYHTWYRITRLFGGAAWSDICQFE